jgi:hypothetical protein
LRGNDSRGATLSRRTALERSGMGCGVAGTIPGDGEPGSAAGTNHQVTTLIKLL